MGLLIALLIATGAVGKFISMSGRAREMGTVSSLREFIVIYYSTATVLHNTLTSVIIILAGGAFCFASGHPWLSVPLASCALVFPLNDIASASGLREYYVLGYYALAAGLSALLYVERLPFIALAVCAGGMFIVFALLAFVSLRRRDR